MRADALNVAEACGGDRIENRAEIIERTQRVKLDRQCVCLRHPWLPERCRNSEPRTVRGVEQAQTVLGQPDAEALARFQACLSRQANG